MSKKPPKYGEEVRRIAEAGLKKHREKGNVVDLTGPMAGDKILTPDGTMKKQRMPKKDRVRFIQLTQIAIAELTERQFEAWADALMDLKTLMESNGWQRGTFINVVQQIEAAAIQASGDPQLGNNARHWLQRKKDMIRLLPTRGKA